MTPVTDRILGKNTAVVFVSPHLDDAALSAGSLILEVAGKVPVHIVTIYTAAEGVSMTMSARKTLTNAGFGSPEQLYDARRREDASVWTRLGVAYHHVGFTEALWRRYDHGTALRRIAGHLVPEYVHLYPTYRWHVSGGSVHRQDAVQIGKISQALRSYIPAGSVVLCPLGIGNHVDHILVRKAVEAIARPVYWTDQPYAWRKAYRAKDLPGHRRVSGSLNRKKKQLIMGYATQVHLLFGSHKVPDLPETFAVPNDI